MNCSDRTPNRINNICRTAKSRFFHPIQMVSLVLAILLVMAAMAIAMEPAPQNGTRIEKRFPMQFRSANGESTQVEAILVIDPVSSTENRKSGITAVSPARTASNITWQQIMSRAVTGKSGSARTGEDCITDWVTENPAQGEISTDESSDIDCIFDGLEKIAPDLLYPPTSTVFQGYLAYRSYSSTGAFLLAWKTTTLKIVYLGPLSDNCPMEIGTTETLKPLLCQSGPEPGGIMPGVWSGSNIQFNVSADGTKITDEGSSIVYNGKSYAFAFGPTTAYVGGTCNQEITWGLLLTGELPIESNQFSGGTTDGSAKFTGKFDSSTTGSGTYQLKLYSDACQDYFISSESWSAFPPPTSGLWSGSNIQFFVSADGTKITDEGSSIVYNGKSYSTAYGPTVAYVGGSCNQEIKITLYVLGELPLESNQIFGETIDGSVKIYGTFDSSTSGSGTYQLDFYFDECRDYFISSESWSVTPADKTTPSAGGNPANGNCHTIVKDNVVIASDVAPAD